MNKFKLNHHCPSEQEKKTGEKETEKQQANQQQRIDHCNFIQ